MLNYGIGIVWKGDQVRDTKTTKIPEDLHLFDLFELIKAGGI